MLWGGYYDQTMRLLASIIVVLCFTAAGAGQTTKPPTRMALMQATGFPNYCGDSLECFVWGSQELIRATVVSIDGEDITVQVRETIKGTATPGTTMVVSAGGWSFGTGQDALLSLVDERSGKKSLRPSFINRPLILDGKRPYYTMDLRPHTDVTDVLVMVRELAAHPGDANLNKISLYSGGKILRVPADPKLEALAHEWAAEKALYRRLLGLQALEPFKSERNIAIATALLDDTRSSDVQGRGKWQVGCYVVREGASKLLKGWGVATPRLTRSGPVFNYREINLPKMRYVVGIAIVLVVLAGWSFHHGSAILLRVGSCVIMLGLIAALLTLWWRSSSRVDEIMFAAGSSHHEIASYGGGIQYQLMHEWDGPRRAVYGSFDREINDDVWSIDLQSPDKRRSVIGFRYASGTGAGPEGSTHPFGVFRIPFWAPLLVAMIPLALNGIALARYFRRRRLGLCRHCGYDLRACSNGKCPECGTPVGLTRGLEAGNEMPIGGHAVRM